MGAKFSCGGLWHPPCLQLVICVPRAQTMQVAHAQSSHQSAAGKSSQKGPASRSQLDEHSNGRQQRESSL